MSRRILMAAVVMGCSERQRVCSGEADLRGVPKSLAGNEGLLIGRCWFFSANGDDLRLKRQVEWDKAADDIWDRFVLFSRLFRWAAGFDAGRFAVRDSEAVSR